MSSRVNPQRNEEQLHNNDACVYTYRVTRVRKSCDSMNIICVTDLNCATPESRRRRLESRSNPTGRGPANKNGRSYIINKCIYMYMYVCIYLYIECMHVRAHTT